MSYYDHNCEDCTHFLLSPEHQGYSSNDYWCDRKGEYKNKNHSACDDFCERGIANSFCYITTMVCDILHLEDDNQYLQSFRKLRNEFMQKNESCRELLVDYDIIGPVIASCLSSDENREMISKNLFNMVIIPVSKLVDNGENIKAIKLYSKMTNILREGYGIKTIISEEVYNNADITKSGHGKYVKKLS